MNSLDEMAKKFGTVTFEGQEYILAEVATLSNRLFDGWWGDADEGEEYTSEWCAPAIGPDSGEYMVIWQFPATKGEEPEDDDWPWDDDHIVWVHAE